MKLKVSPPPRDLPTSLKIHFIMSGWKNQLGWALLGFGLVAFLGIGPKADVSSLWLLANPGETQGTVVRAERTPDVGRRSRWPRALTLQSVTYSYPTMSGNIEATCYDIAGFRDVGNSVTVFYNEKDPNISRISGAWRDVFPPAAILSFLLPILGMLLIIPRLLNGILSLHLAKLGSLTMGTFWAREDMRSIFGEPVQRLEYEYTAQDGVSRNLVHISSDLVALSDGPETPVCYDPAEPSRAMLLVGMPGPFMLSEEGNFELLNPKGTGLLLVIPALSSIGLILLLILSI